MNKILLILISFLPSLINAQCNFNEVEIIVNISPDNFPAETTWDVKIQGGSLVASGTSNSDTFCLPNNNCYDYTIYDQVGDGICCSFGNGSYDLYVDNVLIKSGGSFGLSESTSFNCSPIGHNLPLVIINTNGQTIVDAPDIKVDIGIIDNGIGNLNYLVDPLNDYNGFANIEFRGQSSQSFPKKNYGFETIDQAGVDLDASLLGFPLEEDWILHGPYSDKTLLRNPLAMKIATEMGYYASRNKHCELYINNEYRGVYILMEKIKRDANRVDIAKLEPIEISGDDLTGGYIIRIDKGSDPGWTSQFPAYSAAWESIKFKYVYPKAVNIVPQQEDYIKSYIDSLEYSLVSSDFMYGGKRYDEFLDIKSFVDNYIINEVAKNVDAYRISSYFHKDKDSKGGKLKSMPVWDYNIAFYNADYCNGNTYTGWVYDEHCDDGNPFWIQRMRGDSAFQDILKCRWDEWRSSVLDISYLHNYLDSMAFVLDSAQQRNFSKWPTLGTYVWPNPSPQPSSYQGEIDQVKSFLTNRIAWMDNNINGNPDCSLYEEDTIVIASLTNIKAIEIKLYPNPANNFVNIKTNGVLISEVNVYNVLGENMNLNSLSNNSKLNISGLNKGMYYVQIKLLNGVSKTINLTKI